MKSQWVGQFAVSRERLLMMLKQAFADSEDLWVPERALYTACAFWSAVESGRLRQFLGAAAAEQLRYISIVYAAIGAGEVSTEVDDTLAALTPPNSTHWHQYCISILQARLRQRDDPLLELVAGVAQRLH